LCKSALSLDPFWALADLGDIGDRPLGALVAAARYRIDRDGTDRVGR